MPEITLTRSKKMSINYHTIGYELSVTGSSDIEVLNEIDKLISLEEARLTQFIKFIEGSIKAPVPAPTLAPTPLKTPLTSNSFGNCLRCGAKTDQSWKKICGPCYGAGFRKEQFGG